MYAEIKKYFDRLGELMYPQYVTYIPAMHGKCYDGSSIIPARIIICDIYNYPLEVHFLDSGKEMQSIVQIWADKNKRADVNRRQVVDS